MSKSVEELRIRDRNEQRERVLSLFRDLPDALKTQVADNLWLPAPKISRTISVLETRDKGRGHGPPETPYCACIVPTEEDLEFFRGAILSGNK